MIKSIYFRSALLGSACALAGVFTASAYEFNVPAGDLKDALDSYAKQAGVALMYPDDEVRGAYSKGVKGDLSSDAALSRILSGTGFKLRHDQSGALGVVHDDRGRGDSSLVMPQIKLAAAAPAAAALETVTVTSSKLGGADVQSIPIAITALSQEQLTATQTTGGPDLVKQVPNLTFTKTNFSGYSINIRGIGTQAISVTTDPAVAVAMNDIPFIRNHFFEQEFFDVGQLEVLRGPQGTLYGRNATAGVVNITTAKPTDQFEAMVSGEIGNYQQRRFEGMLNIPIVDDRLDIRLAGEWTKRQGYSYDSLTDERVDGRDLWSGRVSIALKPVENLQMHLVWEHFSENDDRMRSAKQLCERDEGPSSILGVAIPGYGPSNGLADALSQGCSPGSLYSPESFGTVNGQSLSFIQGLLFIGRTGQADPYASVTQSQNLRVIESEIQPAYKAKNDIIEFNADYDVTPALTFTSQTGFDHDFLYSTEDYNRFNTAPGLFTPSAPAAPYPQPPGTQPFFPSRGQVSADGVFCDPQLGCSDRLVAEDLDTLKSWQLSQEFRLSSNFSGPLNFSIGGNYLHYEIDENYYVFINSLTLLSTIVQNTTLPAWQAGVSDNHECLGGYYHATLEDTAGAGFRPFGCGYIDPNPISSLNGNGHNYFRSNNPYVLNSYAGFGEAYYNVTKDIKLVGGLRWTDDQKHFPSIPSFLLIQGWGSYVQNVVDQEWREVTGRADTHLDVYKRQDYNRFNTAPGLFIPSGPAFPYVPGAALGGFPSHGQVDANGVFCDPQVGCSDRLVGEDLDTTKSWQLSQEFRLSSNFSGPFNFSLGGNYLHYEVDESYYVFINALTLVESDPQGGNLPAWVAGVSDNSQCLNGFYTALPSDGQLRPFTCGYIDPNPISSLNGNGHNYFRSHNPYVLNSYAGFGEAYLNVTPDLKLTGGLRWTDDQKHFPMIPSMLLVTGWGYSVQQVVDQEWSKVTGRAAVNWTPKLTFTDQTLLYGSFAHGYKAGGANPPGATLLANGPYDYGAAQPIHPLTFDPEFINAFELGTKNTLLDGALTFNGDLFYYDYTGYQISQIIDRTSVNINVNAKVEGAEVEAAYEPLPGLRFNFGGGWEHSRIDDGQGAIDLIDRTAGRTDWVVVKPTLTRSSNCIVPAYVVSEAVAAGDSDAIFYKGSGGTNQGLLVSACQTAYGAGYDPLTNAPYQYKPTTVSSAIVGGIALPFPNHLPPGYVGFDPLAGTPGDPYTGQNVANGHDYGPAPNSGAGFDKNLGGNELPNTPPFTVSAGAQYTVPVTNDWAATFRADYYWQDYSWARIFNDNPYDRLRGYTNVNLTMILTSQSGWQVMLYDKNVFNTTDITGTFLNSDDSGLTTNVFTTDPRLIGVRVTKNW